MYYHKLVSLPLVKDQNVKLDDLYINPKIILFALTNGFVLLKYKIENVKEKTTSHISAKEMKNINEKLNVLSGLKTT